ncbi:hypothetical protein Scep_003260 [Stephania cephalantha]|uniref:Growth-regulating factor n=1 Tax=Stephania cephalantha TaxID=152367 RepID=A0AAP0PXV7_9MAGN
MDSKPKRLAMTDLTHPRPDGKIPRHFYEKSLAHQLEAPSDTVIVTAKQVAANQHSPISPPLIYPKLEGFYTLKQWEELELQAFIFKYMKAGETVPDELVELIRKSLPREYSSQQKPKGSKPTGNGHWRSGVVDTEPGRCRRCDGKKWRCARNAAEGRGYCERHTTWGSKRPRKPVPVANNMRNSNSNSNGSSSGRAAAIVPPSIATLLTSTMVFCATRDTPVTLPLMPMESGGTHCTCRRPRLPLGDGGSSPKVDSLRLLRESKPFRHLQPLVKAIALKQSPAKATHNGLGPIFTGMIPRHYYQKSLPHDDQNEAPSDIVTLSLFETTEQRQQRIMSEYQASSIYPPLIYPKLGGFFSLRQWHELELQAFIFKFMMAKATMPDELVELIRKTIPKTPTPTYVHYVPSQQRPMPSITMDKGKEVLDLEPGRCRRTDGRKWRCTREAVEGANYCAHHWHRGRSKRARMNPPAEQEQRHQQQASHPDGNAAVGARSYAVNNNVQRNPGNSSTYASYNGGWTYVGTHRLPLARSSPRIHYIQLGKNKNQSS